MTMERFRSFAHLRSSSLFILFTILTSRWIGVECLSPHFFLCNYHGKLDPMPHTHDKLLLSVALDGNPTSYEPGETYRVRVTSSKDFNGLLITGLFSSLQHKEKLLPSSYGMTSIGFSHHHHVSSDFICGLLYSDISPYKKPTSEVTFSWTAPEEGTGCVSFLLTASLRMQIVFQDVVAYQICESGQDVKNLRPSLADIHSDGVIIRDDFDSSEDLFDIWSRESHGVEISNECGEITHGNSAVFCGRTGTRQLISSPLNLTSASAIQFTIGSGKCEPTKTFVTLSYRFHDDEFWNLIKDITVTQQSKIHIIHLPKDIRTEDVLLQFSQEVVDNGCWALDNVLISETNNRPSLFHENMDPSDTSNWLFMPGAKIKGECMSHGNAMVFNAEVNDTSPVYAVTRDLDLSGASIDAEPLEDSEIEGGRSERGACGHSHESSTFIFDGAGPRKFCTTAADNLRLKTAISFVLSIGSGNCQARHSTAVVVLSSRVGKSKTVLRVFDHEAYKEPRKTIVQIPESAKVANAVLCLEQGQHNGHNTDVWAVDSVELIERRNEIHHFMQFSLNMQCTDNHVDSRMNVEYSNDFGRSWSILQEECLPETCQGMHWPFNSIYKSGVHHGWVRLTLPLPEAALTKHTRFRFIQDGYSTVEEIKWAIDNIFIGIDEQCPRMCSGHGTCLHDGCRCDVGYFGISCNTTSDDLPSSLAADFNTNNYFTNMFKMATGSEIGYDCGLLGTGKALVFNGEGDRRLITKPYNGTNLKYLQFAILMGRHSSVGTCQSPQVPGDGILVHYTTNHGVTWNLMEVIPFDAERKTRVVSIPLPHEASVPGLQIRWWQPNENRQGKAVWALDDVILTSDLYKSIFSTAENYQKIYHASVSFHTGLLTNQCNGTNILLFSPQPSQYIDTLRYAETQTMETSEGYVLEADINLGCSLNPSNNDIQDQNHEVLLQYSKDEGVTWHLVLEENLPGSTNEDSYHSASVYHISEYNTWRTATVPMPENTWSSSLRLRVVQNEKSNSVWALNHVYMGPACSMHCRNRGRCRNGKCICNADSQGPSCLSRSQLPSGINEVFNDVHRLYKTGWNLLGGSVASSAVDKAGCGPMSSGFYMHFHKAGVRKLSTPDLDTSLGGQIQFYIRIGGGNCKVPTERANGVLLQYSNNGGVTWHLLDELYFNEYLVPKYVHRDIPAEARTKQTRFQWWQPKNEGSDRDEWSITNIIVGEPMLSDDESIHVDHLKISSRRSIVDYRKAMPRAFILLSNDGNEEDFCDPRTNSYVFNKLKGDRFAVTDELMLRAGDTIQFEINIGCSRNFSWIYPVRLEYSHDEGYSWDLLKRACYPNGRPRSQMMIKNPIDKFSAHDCTGVARELTEASIYHQGEFPQWKRIIISVPERIAATSVRLRLWQHVPVNLTSDNLPPTWAVRYIHIGPSCPVQCSGHGTCTIGFDSEQMCICDPGFIGESCMLNTAPLTSFWDHFTSTSIQNKWWKNILGSGCEHKKKSASLLKLMSTYFNGVEDENICENVFEGRSLCFGGKGTRKAETVSMDTRGIRLIQFYLRIGSIDDSETCLAPEHRDEAVLLQYSNDNGISWNLIKELSFDAYSSRSEKVTADIPFRAKTLSTSFRWWQPLREKEEHRSQWALDDIFIGVPDLLPEGFSDNFESGFLSDRYWYKIRGERIGNFIHCDGTSDKGKHALIISSASGVVETWDFHLHSGSFLQFDLIMSCQGHNPANDVLSLEYSTNMGLSWQLVIPSCIPSTSSGCDHGFGTLFYAGLHQKWTRRTISLPESLTSSPKIRFRWIQYYFTEGSSCWGIDNVYLGNDCPWMCNGHGRCWPSRENAEASCICDPGYNKLSYCQPSVSLSPELMDTFDEPWTSENKYSLIVGQDSESTSDIIVNEENIQMGSAGIRMISTTPMNTTDTKYMQFHVTYIGKAVNPTSTLIIQSSKNGGISWSTIHKLYGKVADEKSRNFVHIALPDYARHEAVTFRIWQANAGAASSIFEADRDVWAIDNLFIGGHESGCEAHFLEDGFDRNELNKNWLLETNDTIVDFCKSDAKAAAVNHSIVGQHSVTTKDLCIAENYVLQFKIAVGCSAASSSLHGVQLEYSTDHGITWSLLRSSCHGNEPLPSGCSDKFYPSSIYYPGTHPGWKRYTIPLSKDLCGSVRFRWYQGFYADAFAAASAVTWGIDDVYIGPGCDQMCNGHGVCTNEGNKCICDSGFTGPTCCDLNLATPTYFIETFNKPEFQNEKWKTLSGGDIIRRSTQCEEKDEIRQWSYIVNKPGVRMLETQDIDMRNAEFIQFYMIFTHESKEDTINGRNSEQIAEIHPVTEYIYLQYSTDGGITWIKLEGFPFLSAKINETQNVVLKAPEGARSNATRLRWWQPMLSNGNEFGFIIDNIVVGYHHRKIDDDFSSYIPFNWIEMSGSEIQPSVGTSCCKSSSSNKTKCDLVEIGSSGTDRRDCDTNFITTNGVHVGQGSFVSFNLKMNCPVVSNHCESIELQYSIDLGKTWLQLVPPCYPNNAECTYFYQGSSYFSDVYPATDSDENRNRIIVPIPEHAWSPSTRFRWLQRMKADSKLLSIDNVYIGGVECPGACSGHGHCHHSRCICDSGWTGHMCETSTKQMPKELKEIFISKSKLSMFSKVVGAKIDEVCGEVGYDTSLHFFGGCSRLLETIQLNTTKADFVQFMYRTGCSNILPKERNNGILVDYTTNGGAVWHNLAELYFKNHNKPSFINILLPEAAKAVGTQFRWWQPKHSGLNHEDWSIDNLLIGGKREEVMLSDDFNVVENIGPAGLWFDRGDKDMWQFYDNTQPNSFCGRDNVILAGTVPGLDTTVSTKDFFPEEGFMMQYTIVVLCENVQKNHQPVHVQYSTDFGDTWQYLVPQCIPSDRDCFGKKMEQPSAHFISKDWRRKTIWIPSSLYDQPVRFRFHQEESDVKWALDRLFIGPSCPDACSGHGDCVGVPQDDMFKTGKVNYDLRRCLCDLGYERPNCYLNIDRNHKYLKDDFNAGDHIGNWLTIEPHIMDTHCGVLVDGKSMGFKGVGPRQAETEDLDLRDATFVQHNAIIGHGSHTCLPAKRREDGLLLQYSTDGGITWEMLHELDYTSFSNSTHEYVSLPLNAKTNATRMRWWQPFTINQITGLAEMGGERAGWAIDNVYIGGHEINSYSFENGFEVHHDGHGSRGSLDEQEFEFYPNGRIGIGQCSGDNTSHMMWHGTHGLFMKQSLTTRQLIVTPGHLLQFKIKVGCTDVHACSQHFPIKLEYREDPSSENWILVKPVCFPSNNPSPRCPPYIFHDASTYTLEYKNIWRRVTIPLNHISSGTTQFRWFQDDNASKLHSWAIDDIYIGESCPGFCSGHGKCTKSQQCICDNGYTGKDCSRPKRRHIVPIFLDNFEEEFINKKLWKDISGGMLTAGGCGPLKPYGFSRSAYFSDCGERQIVSREMDLTRAWQIQYVLQFGSVIPNKDCRVEDRGFYDGTPMSMIVLQFTTNNGVTWHTLREHSPAHYGIPRRVGLRLPAMAKSQTTILRWWQPTHGGEGRDQWALDNVDINMNRHQRHHHLIDYWAMRKKQENSEINFPNIPRKSVTTDLKASPGDFNSHPDVQALKSIEIPSLVSGQERVPPDDELP
ncbi:reelin-like isoform X1 [Styela clava]